MHAYRRIHSQTNGPFESKSFWSCKLKAPRSSLEVMRNVMNRKELSSSFERQASKIINVHSVLL